MIPLYIIAGLITSAFGESLLVEPTLRVDLQPPMEFQRLSTRNVFQSWITMPVNHFDPQNSDTFRMRFMFNEQFFGGEGYPVFILVGGEWDIAPGWLLAGNMFMMAQENKGYIIYTEHRYYGQTLPYEVFTTENLRFLNVDQALADLAYFIKELKKTRRFSNSKIILYGGSYAANMVLWFKQRYPHLAVGTVASSGPILGQVDFTGYLEVVHEAFFLEGGEQCLEHIRRGIADTIDAMSTEEGRRQIERDYRLCTPIDYDNPYDLGYFSGLISWTFSTSVQQARPGSLTDICNNFNTNTYGFTPMQKIGGYIAAIRNMSPTSCWTVTFDAYINFLNVTRSNSRAWYYQTCTEYGYYQTAPRSGTVFDQLKWLSVDFYIEICKQVFDQRFDENFVNNAVERVNLMFGGLEPDVNSTINIHGYIDPWRALGVYDRDLKEGSPTITVPRATFQEMQVVGIGSSKSNATADSKNVVRFDILHELLLLLSNSVKVVIFIWPVKLRASHCFDMQGWMRNDTILMTNAQQAARRLVASWLSD